MQTRFPSIVPSGLSFLALLTVAVTTPGCGGGPGCSAGFFIEHAALEVTAARDTRTGAVVPRVVLSNILFNGAPVADGRELVPEGRARGVTLVGETLECDVPCAFGTNFGTYRFTISAPGYQFRSAEFRGGPIFPNDSCPGSGRTSGSTKIEFALDPQ